MNEMGGKEEMYVDSFVYSFYYYSYFLFFPFFVVYLFVIILFYFLFFFLRVNERKSLERGKEVDISKEDLYFG